MATAESAGARRFLEVQEGMRHAHSGVHPVVELVLTLMEHSGVSTQYQLHGVRMVTYIHAGQTCKTADTCRHACLETLPDKAAGRALAQECECLLWIFSF